MRELSFLVTNDDGIESPFLAALVAALLARGRVTVVAPRVQQSWIGKALSRHRPVATAQRNEVFGCDAWDAEGTPADCVNLALAHFCSQRVDVVVSGINIGSNAALPLILASGTVGGALEGSLHGFHAVASSMRLTPEEFAIVRAPGAKVPGHLRESLTLAARRTADLATEIARRPRPRKFLVHNLNFPNNTTEATPLLRTVPALLRAGPLFAPAAEQTGVYQFSFGVGDELPSPLLTDRTCLESGRASYSVLDFGRLGVTSGPFGEVPPAEVPARSEP